jgi:hypothetical protein
MRTEKKYFLHQRTEVILLTKLSLSPNCGTVTAAKTEKLNYVQTNKKLSMFIVPDKRSRILEVVVVRRMIMINLGIGNLEWGGKGKG